jgi:hypothetical protein
MEPVTVHGPWRSSRPAGGVGWIPAPAIGKVGQEWWLGQHGNTGNSIEASQGGVDPRKTMSAVAQYRWGCSLASS